VGGDAGDAGEANRAPPCERIGAAIRGGLGNEHSDLVTGDVVDREDARTVVAPALAAQGGDRRTVGGVQETVIGVAEQFAAIRQQEPPAPPPGRHHDGALK
jgi:hypothetical protein